MVRRPSSRVRYGLAAACVVLPLALSACPGDSEPFEPIGSNGGFDEDCDEGLRESISQLQLTVNRDVDILFVIDNSGSMGEEQAALNAGLDDLLAQLDESEANYRIGFTTTDNGNPWCPAGQTTPEGGKLVLSPCTERLENFSFNNGEIDASELACTSQCSLDAAALSVSPTTTDVDPNARARPWIQFEHGVSNLPEQTSMLDALRCFAPQGINGCGFESQLESMYLGLLRAMDSTENSYGFLRSNALLALVLVSDEADCSHNKSWSEIFADNGNKVFWSDPTSPFPTSAVCWNAGVHCEGDPNGYASCEPSNKDVNGNRGAAQRDAVLHPMARYLGLLEGIEQEKQQLNPSQEIIVMAISGVEGGGADASVNYAAGDDPEFLDSFGVGPGCMDAQGEAGAVPPVRMRALAEAFGEEGLYSVCDSDYSTAMGALGESIGDQLLPACFSQCVGDADPTTPQREISCRLELDPPGNDNTTLLSECPREPDTDNYLLDAATGDAALPEGEDLCYVMRMDSDGQQTADPLDDMSPYCADQHFNLEFDLVYRAGVPLPGGSSVSVVCGLAACPEIECPGIGG